MRRMEEKQGMGTAVASRAATLFRAVIDPQGNRSISSSPKCRTEKRFEPSPTSQIAFAHVDLPTAGTPIETR